MPPELAPLLRAMADELDRARATLESLSGSLCADLDVVQRHAEGLQALDSVGQTQAALAAVLRAAEPFAAVTRIPLETLRERLCLAQPC